MNKKSDAWTARVQRQLTELSEYSVNIRYIRGQANQVADSLSRLSINAANFGIDWEDIASEQRRDPEVTAHRSLNSSLNLQDIPIPGCSSSILCDISLGRPRPILPSTKRKEIFNLFQGLSHPGIRATKRLITDRVIWKGSAKDICKWTRECSACQTSKVHRHTYSSICPEENPSRRFSAIHVDIVGPLPPSRGFNYLFRVIDRPCLSQA